MDQGCLVWRVSADACDIPEKARSEVRRALQKIGWKAAVPVRRHAAPTIVGDSTVRQRQGQNDDDEKKKRVKDYVLKPLLMYLAALFASCLFSVLFGFGIWTSVVVHNFILFFALPGALAAAVALGILFGGDADPSRDIVIELPGGYKIRVPAFLVIVMAVLFLIIVSAIILAR